MPLDWRADPPPNESHSRPIFTGSGRPTRSESTGPCRSDKRAGIAGEAKSGIE